jgi:hypothetical protein
MNKAMHRQISLLSEQRTRFVGEAFFTSKSGPTRESPPATVDDLDAYRSTKKR